MSRLAIFVVYDHPRDDPGHVVVRRWDVGIDGGLIAGPAEAFADVDAARAALTERGLVPLVRAANDDPVIVESWV